MKTWWHGRDLGWEMDLFLLFNIVVSCHKKTIFITWKGTTNLNGHIFPKGLNEYLLAVDFPRESHVPSAVKIWVKGIPTRTGLTKMDLASFINTWNEHQDRIHLFQVCHLFAVWCLSSLLFVFATSYFLFYFSRLRGENIVTRSC
jgi:hypothetical protein